MQRSQTRKAEKFNNVYKNEYIAFTTGYEKSSRLNSYIINPPSLAKKSQLRNALQKGWNFIILYF